MPDSSSFRLRQVAGASFAFAEGILFDIHDVTNDLICVYNYNGVSESIGLPSSATFRGPWNPFQTSRPTQVDSFGGLLEVSGGGAGSAGVTIVTIRPMFGPTVTIAPFEGGFTLGGTVIGTGAGIFGKMFPPLPAARAPFPHSL